jgi:uncharacterized membrane protein YphA (DoxX/SURF4 family)
MATTIPIGDSHRPLVHAAHNPVYEAFWILRIAFAIVPIIAGIDKFLHVLVNWDLYLSPMADRILGGHGHQFMLVVGVVEIIAGIGVALKPRYFGYVVAIWLLLIIINLLMAQGSYDIALRDLGLGLGALALARLSVVYDPVHGREPKA